MYPHLQQRSVLSASAALAWWFCFTVCLEGRWYINQDLLLKLLFHTLMDATIHLDPLNARESFQLPSLYTCVGGSPLLRVAFSSLRFITAMACAWLARRNPPCGFPCTFVEVLEMIGIPISCYVAFYYRRHGMY